MHHQKKFKTLFKKTTELCFIPRSSKHNSKYSPIPINTFNIINTRLRTRHSVQQKMSYFKSELQLTLLDKKAKLNNRLKELKYQQQKQHFERYYRLGESQQEMCILIEYYKFYGQTSIIHLQHFHKLMFKYRSQAYYCNIKGKLQFQKKQNKSKIEASSQWVRDNDLQMPILLNQLSSESIAINNMRNQLSKYFQHNSTFSSLSNPNNISNPSFGLFIQQTIIDNEQGKSNNFPPSIELFKRINKVQNRNHSEGRTQKSQCRTVIIRRHKNMNSVQNLKRLNLNKHKTATVTPLKGSCERKKMKNIINIFKQKIIQQKQLLKNKNIPTKNGKTIKLLQKTKVQKIEKMHRVPMLRVNKKVI